MAIMRHRPEQREPFPGGVSAQEVTEFAGVSCEVVRSKVRIARLELKEDRLRVVAPPRFKVRPFLEKHRGWIERNADAARACREASKALPRIPRSPAAFRRLVEEMAVRLTREQGTTFARLFFRDMKTRWASCTNARNLTFNLRMRELPEELIEYVVFHEITHLVHRRHNRLFRNRIKRRYPDYKEKDQLLDTYWYAVGTR